MFGDELQSRGLCWMRGPAGLGEQVLGYGDAEALGAVEQRRSLQCREREKAAVVGAANSELVILLALVVFTVPVRLRATLSTRLTYERAG